MIFADDEQINKLKLLTESVEFDTRNLLKYAIPEIVYSRNKVYLDKVIANDWDSVDENTHSVIRNILSTDSSCMGVIVSNLMSANLIPDIQKRFANIIMGK